MSLFCTLLALSRGSKNSLPVLVRSRTSFVSQLLRSAFLLRRSGMAHWPRWIDDDTVDSAVMLGAYVRYIAERDRVGDPVPACFGHLWTVEHRKVLSIWDVVATPVEPPVALLHRQCNGVGCLRCQEGRGGFQFRWYCAAWAKYYNQQRRAGAWEAPELQFSQSYPDH